MGGVGGGGAFSNCNSSNGLFTVFHGDLFMSEMKCVSGKSSSKGKILSGGSQIN